MVREGLLGNLILSLYKAAAKKTPACDMIGSDLEARDQLPCPSEVSGLIFVCAAPNYQPLRIRSWLPKHNAA